jgi:hypothetical protein
VDSSFCGIQVVTEASAWSDPGSSSFSIIAASDDFAFLRLGIRATDGDIDDETSDGKLKLDESGFVSCELSSAVSIESRLDEGGTMDAEAEPSIASSV